MCNTCKKVSTYLSTRAPVSHPEVKIIKTVRKQKMSDMEESWLTEEMRKRIMVNSPMNIDMRRQIIAESDKILKMSIRIMEDMAKKVKLNLLQSKVTDCLREFMGLACEDWFEKELAPNLRKKLEKKISKMRNCFKTYQLKMGSRIPISQTSPTSPPLTAPPPSSPNPSHDPPSCSPLLRYYPISHEESDALSEIYVMDLPIAIRNKLMEEHLMKMRNERKTEELPVGQAERRRMSWTMVP